MLHSQLPGIRHGVAGLSDRKYRQHGYQDSGGERQKPSSDRSGEGPARKDTFGPRPVQMPGTQNVSRCAQCGTVLTTVSEPLGQCPKCACELQSCKQWANVAPSRRFECMQRVAERIGTRDASNECACYSVSSRVR